MNPNMKTFVLPLDPRMASALDAWAREAHTNRTALIRDILYTALASAKATGARPKLEQAPMCARGKDAPEDVRLLKTGAKTHTWVKVDANGLVLR